MRAALVFPATSYRPDAFLAAADAMGVEVVLVTDQPGAAVRFGRDCHKVDLGDPIASARALSLGPIDGAVAVDEKSAVIAAALSPAYHSLEGVLAARDKRRMRERLTAAGVSCPHHVVLARGAELARAVRFPCVVKPPMLSGSQGVIRADDADELHAAIGRARRILHRHAAARGAEDAFFDLLVEDYVPGPEVTIEGIMQHGELLPIAVFDKPDPLDGPFFEETIYVTPSSHPPALVARAIATAEAAARALGLGHGPVHAELRLGGAEPALIEIAARSIGGLCSRALAHVMPATLETLLLRQLAGERLAPIPPPACASGVMMLPVRRSGIVRRIDGLDAARAVAGVDAVMMSVASGEAVRALPEGNSYPGFVFAHGATPRAVADALRRAERAITLELSPLLGLY
jgi:biotin carboxylase